MRKIFKKNKFGAIFAILLLIQILYMIYWGNAKGGFYVDEFFTYDNAHYISASTPKRVKLYDAGYMEYGKWFDVQELKSTLTVDRNISLLNDGIAYNVKAFLKKPYMAVLNCVEAFFYPGELSKWSGISINILFFAIAQIFLYMLAKKITCSDISALLSVAMFGFSGLAISIIAYVRFYMLVNMWMIIFLYLHSLMWTENDLKKNIIYEVFAMAALYLAFRNSPLVVLEGAAVIFLFSISLPARKRKQQFLFYAVPIFAGGILYMALFTGYMQIAFNTGGVAEGSMGVAAASLVRNLLNLTPANFADRSIVLLHLINDYLFAHAFVAAAVVVLILIAAARRLLKRELLDENRSFAYFMLFGTAVLFFIASVCLKLVEIRYNSFIYPVISVLAVAAATDMAGIKRKGQWVTFVMISAVCAQVYFTATIPRIQNSYPEDRQAVEAIKDNKGIDNLVIDYKADDRVMYECLAYGDDAAKVMFMRFEERDLKNLPDAMLVWQSVNWSAEIVDELKKAGYASVEQIAQTHESMVFLCGRAGTKNEKTKTD